MSIGGRWVAAAVAAALCGPSALFGEPEPKAEFTDQQRSYWAFQPVERPSLADSAHPVDELVQRAQSENSVHFSPEADRVTLIRRAYLDVTGLPPSPAQVSAFLDDDAPNAWDKVVDDVLASPHYGERWARHWLDLARFAESEGFKSDETRPNAWRYRDYVIRSFNADKPYDRFVQEQIAGDELWPDSPDARVATGFNRHYPDETNAANLQQRRSETLLDITDAVGSTFLGLTYGCAKCHDHKFDPILQADYYKLLAFFANTIRDDNVVMLQGRELAEHQRRRAEWEQATAEIRAEMDALLDKQRREKWDHLAGKRTPEVQAVLKRAVDNPDDLSFLKPYERQMYAKHIWQLKYITKTPALLKSLNDEDEARYHALEARLKEFDHLNPGELPVGMGLREVGPEAPRTHVLGLSNFEAPLDPVEPGFLSILDAGEPEIATLPASTGRRSALARWMTRPENPLTARVMVNRIWQHHFGTGIVSTPGDFGFMGERPTNPALLDFLADEFVRQGWSVKALHRLIMTSATYRQASLPNEDMAKLDPDNRYLWRYPPRRLEGEAIRDAMLATAGQLDRAIGGPSVFPALPDGAPTPRGGWSAADEAPQTDRRSVYIFVRRNARYPMMASLDMPDTHHSCARRTVTITAPQALSLLNSAHTVRWAEGLAGRVLTAAGDDTGEQVAEAYRLAYAREPDPWERDASLTFLAKQTEIVRERIKNGEDVAVPVDLPQGLDLAMGAALVDMCHALLNSNEFVYLR